MRLLLVALDSKILPDLTSEVVNLFSTNIEIIFNNVKENFLQEIQLLQLKSAQYSHSSVGNEVVTEELLGKIQGTDSQPKVEILYQDVQRGLTCGWFEN